MPTSKLTPLAHMKVPPKWIKLPVKKSTRSIDQTNASKAKNDAKQAIDQTSEMISTDVQTDKGSSRNDKIERDHLVGMIHQELIFIMKVCPRLGKHEEDIRKAAEKAYTDYIKIKDELCEIKELKYLKKTVTKLKLQIPAGYRTYDESYKQTNAENKAISKLLKKMPRFHDKLFHRSPFCKAIQLRFNNLESHLKLCLLCFSVFPENAIISRRSMVYWWIGEGLTPCEDDLEGGSTAEDSANEYFQKLIDMEFIEPVSRSYRRYVAFCKMHPLVRAALVMIADKINFFDFDEYGNPKDFGKFDEIGSPEDLPLFYPLDEPREFFYFFNEKQEPIPEPIQFFDSERNPYQFAAMNQVSSQSPSQSLVDRNGEPINKTRKYYFYSRKKIITKSYNLCLMGSGLSEGITWEKLHMLFNVGDIFLEFKPEWFLRMKNINVLFLGRWKSSAAHYIAVDEFEFEKSLDNMNHLRFFSLQGVSRIPRLPDSISRLTSLLILDLRACEHLEVIPETIGSLKCLTHLDISECYRLMKMPKDISCLKSLQVLKGFVVFETPGQDVCTLKDLNKLRKLRKLNIFAHMKDFPKESHLEDLENLETLRKLTILWGSNIIDPFKIINSKKKHNLVSKFVKLITKKKRGQGSTSRGSNSTLGAQLEKLDLKCFPHVHKAPEWLKPGNLKGLKKLYIRGGGFSDLGQYQDDFQWDEHSPVLPIETWDVEVLRLKYLEELDMEWGELQSLFPKLISLEKVKCPRLTLFPCNEHGVWRSDRLN
ncbi:hypothetical protein SSX86_013020 [Deinandra increscens subsp. villosa]|uniref:Disease resistance RPP13-like protein 4 n=1 Tax=Deinandra increscens subsp. villosa TaxID=3103831 RepID=A0AAP0DCV4_9ASTR